MNYCEKSFTPHVNQPRVFFTIDIIKFLMQFWHDRALSWIVWGLNRKRRNMPAKVFLIIFSYQLIDLLEFLIWLWDILQTYAFYLSIILANFYDNHINQFNFWIAKFPTLQINFSTFQLRIVFSFTKRIVRHKTIKFYTRIWQNYV